MESVFLQRKHDDLELHILNKLKLDSHCNTLNAIVFVFSLTSPFFYNYILFTLVVDEHLRADYLNL